MHEIFIFKKITQNFIANVGTPFMMLPTLNWEGKVISGNCTVARFLAEKHGTSAQLNCPIQLIINDRRICAIGLGGKNDVENAEIASYVEGLDDIFVRLIAYYFEEDETAKVPRARPSV